MTFIKKKSNRNLLVGASITNEWYEIKMPLFMLFVYKGRASFCLSESTGWEFYLFD